MLNEDINQIEKNLNETKKNLKNYEIQSSYDAELIKKIKNEIFNKKTVELIRNNKNIIQSSLDKLYEHQKLTSVAIHPFIKINNEVKVDKHFLIEIDPLISIDKKKEQKKFFDALILNLEEKYNTLIFLEIKTNDNFDRAIAGIIKKIKYYESSKMQNYIKKYFKKHYNLEKIDRIEYVLVTYPYEYVYEGRKLKNKKIKIINEDFEEVVSLPLIIWTVNRAHKDEEANFYYLLYHPINETVEEARDLRQHHKNNNLIKFLSKKNKFDVSTKLFSLKFSPALDFNYQFIMITTELLKLNKSRNFTKNQMEDLVFNQLLLNLKKRKIAEFLVEKYLNKGLSSGIYKQKEETEEYEIKLMRTKQSLLIQKEIIEKISQYKAKKKVDKPEVNLDLLKKVEINYIMNRERKGKLISDYF